MPQVVLLITALGQAVHLLKALLHALFWYLKEPHDINCSITSALAKLDWLLVPEQCPQCPEVREEPGLRASEWIPPNPRCVAVWGCILTGLSVLVFPSSYQWMGQDPWRTLISTRFSYVLTIDLSGASETLEKVAGHFFLWMWLHPHVRSRALLLARLKQSQEDYRKIESVPLDCVNLKITPPLNF